MRDGVQSVVICQLVLIFVDGRFVDVRVLDPHGLAQRKAMRRRFPRRAR